MVVSVPDPAISGKAIGTTNDDFESLSLLNNSIPRTISIPRMKMMIDPATAKEWVSTPNTCNKGSPKNKNKIIRPPEIRVAFTSCMPPICFFRDNSRGIEPTISMTANRVKVTVRNSLNPGCIMGISTKLGLCLLLYQLRPDRTDSRRYGKGKFLVPVFIKTKNFSGRNIILCISNVYISVCRIYIQAIRIYNRGAVNDKRGPDGGQIIRIQYSNVGRAQVTASCIQGIIKITNRSDGAVNRFDHFIRSQAYFHQGGGNGAVISRTDHKNIT